MTIDEIEIQIKDNATKAKAILTDENGVVADAQALLNKNDELKAKIDALKSIDAQLLPVKSVENTTEVKMTSKIEFKSSNPLSSLPFQGSNDEKGLKAYKMGQFALAATGNQKAQSYLAENGLWTKNVNETTDSQGGYLVPDELLAELIYLRAQYGVVRRNADVRRASSDTLWIPKMSADAAVYWTTEGTAITPSQPTFSRVQALMKKLSCLVPVTTEVNDDALVDIGASLSRSMAVAFSQEEDRVMSVGVGTTSADGFINGFVTEVTDVASNAGVITAAAGSTANWTAVTIGNLRSMVAALPRKFLIPGEVKFYCSRAFYENVICNRLDNLSGNGTLDLINFADGRPTLFGYDIEYIDDLASTAAGASGQALAAFGNLRQSAVLADRRDMRVQVSDQFYFDQDVLAFKATQRIGFEMHEPGTSAVAGGITVLKRV
jgi:HK97 family phage major capsid protein